MPISQGDLLFSLIKSLTKAEKRNFTLYVRRIQSEGDVRFFQLFEILEKQSLLDEEAAMEKLDEPSKSKFSNLKRHLYQHILTCLRLIHIKKQLDIQIRELIDYAQVLYGRGLYIQALKILSRTKSTARSNNMDLLHLEIVEFEKKIESRHITRSTTERIEQLQQEASERTTITQRIVDWSNLKLHLQRLFILNGHAQDEADRNKIKQRYELRFADASTANQTFFEKIYFYQSLYWYHYILFNIEECHSFALKWTNLYRENPNMITEDVDIYMMGLNHLLSTSFFLRDYATFAETLARLETFRQETYHRFNTNSKILSFLYVHQGRLNKCFMDGQFNQALELIPRTLKRIRRYGSRVDPHKLQILYYKFAWMYLGINQADNAIEYLNKIIHSSSAHLREDIRAYAELMLLMAHYDLNNLDILEYLVNSTSRKFAHLHEPNPILVQTLNFFRKITKLNPQQMREKFKEFHLQLHGLEKDPFLRRSFTYLDVNSWVESKIQQRPLGQIVQQKFKTRTTV
ncbi:MAG: hypothetical protein DHS20C18_40590 [Saprospiraceae bacterium]|nr:MAG: hypothetical protein DHS20C18_40590 [Saprospiraceae bacterium]